MFLHFLIFDIEKRRYNYHNYFKLGVILTIYQSFFSSLATLSVILYT